MLRQFRVFENDIILVSRARVDGPADAAGLRAAAGGGVAEAAFACSAAAAFPAAFRFLDVLVVVGVVVEESFALATLPSTVCAVTASGARFAPSETVCAAVADTSVPFFFPVVAAEENSKSMS